MAQRSSNPLVDLHGAGQSFWMDAFSRELVDSGKLAGMIKADGLRGVTSNPDILEKAINGTSRYDREIRRMAAAGLGVAEIYEAIAVDDIRAGADVLRPVWEKSGGVDGCISLEVSPYLACDADGTVEEARRLWAAVDRPNLMIKVPATPAGILAIRQLIAEGIPVNVTLIFSLAAYKAVMDAHIAGLADRAKAKLPVDGSASVASFFISRLDTVVDRLIGFRVESLLPKVMKTAPLAAGGSTPVLYHRAGELFGKAAIASAKLAYALFRRRYSQADFKRLAAKGAKVQRPLWASTSTKNPLYPETLYVDSLVGRDTVNTMPPSTIAAFRGAGVVRENAIEEGLDDAHSVLGDLASLGIDLESVCGGLLEEGIQKFNQPFDKLLGALSGKRFVFLGLPDGGQRISLASGDKAAVNTALGALSEARLTPRIYGKDSTLYASGLSEGALHGKILNRLGWLDAPEFFLEKIAEIQGVVQKVKRSGITDVVLLGMGGSSLCPEVCRNCFGSASGHPRMHVLDTTEAVTIAATEKKLQLNKTLFVSASKSGGTIETATLAKYFTGRLREAGVKKPGAHFLAITDPGTALEALAREEQYLYTFINPPDIGGRFSALSYFGLVPMALLGIDIRKLLKAAVDFVRDGRSLLDVEKDPAVRLGVTLAVLARRGRDKLTLILSPQLATLGLWIEQLVAESTGKGGQGILPVDGEGLQAAKSYGSDRVFVAIETRGDLGARQKTFLESVESLDHPVVRITLRNTLDLGLEFLRWELATAAMGTVLNINPFDEPNVTESKENTGAILAEKKASGKLPTPKAFAKGQGLEVVVSEALKKAVGLKAGAGVEGALKALVGSAGARDFLAILAFLPPQAAEKSLAAIRASLGKKTGCATTLGYGPRYLHSTGQHHKGGPNDGIFLVLTHEAPEAIAVAGTDLSFDGLCRAQALGDFRSLEAHGRRAILVHLGRDVEGGLKALAEVLCAP
jgi:transaldolase/glucose-6-phosphate isomerase